MPLDQASHSWSTSQLVEYLAALSEQSDEIGAMRAAVERVLESLDAEVGVLFGAGSVAVVVGLPADDPQVATLTANARNGSTRVDIAGLGRCRTAVVALDVGDDALRLLVARAGPEDFVPDEMLLLRGMAWVLNLALRPLRVLGALHERQRVLEQMSRVQRAIASRSPLPEVFDVVTEGALGLFGNELAALYLADHNELVVASVCAARADYRPPSWPQPLTSGVGRAAYLRGDLVRVDDYPVSPDATAELVACGAQAAMAAPVRENGVVVGSLAVMSFRPGHSFTDAQQQTLLTFADQVSVALSDAKTLATALHAVRDVVTGLPNRVLFLERLEQALKRPGRIHVLFLDLDRFKPVNDTLGHAAGDELLGQVGRRLRDCLRDGDCLARFGGDEYAVLMENASAATARRVAERMLRAVREPYLVRGEEVVVGGSIGVVGSRGGVEAGEVMREADMAMYRAKRAGGDRVVVFEPGGHSAVTRRRGLEADLRRAIDADDIRLVYQPIVDLRYARRHSAEALARWHHPVRGTVPPAVFIPLAEEAGLIVGLGRKVLAAACEHAAAWPRSAGGDEPPDLSVNLSARQILAPAFVADVRAILTATGLDPNRLILEITESTIVSDTTAVLRRLRQIRDIGVRLAIDDFGTGYSSLSCLRYLPADILKIDRSFIDGVATGWQGTAFVRTIMRLTETLSLTAVAEGVETREQVDVLRQVGCHLAQGFLFAEPMAPADFVAHLAVDLPALSPV